MQATFIDFSTFKTSTPATLARYYIIRPDGYVLRAIGITASGVAHMYTMATDEDVLATGVGSDTWFVGAMRILEFIG